MVDLPHAAGGRVDITFVGVKDGKLATAQTSMTTRNDPKTFRTGPFFTPHMRDLVPEEPAALIGD